MGRFFRNLVLILLFAVALGGGIALYASHDAMYTLQEWIGWSRFHRYDSLIEKIASKNHMDPMLLKAVVWRESTFDPNMVGKDGEHGLMQVTEGAAQDWSSALKTQPPTGDELFNPATNIEVGAWYLNRALQYYNTRDNAVPFALAEYNAGRQRVTRWQGENNLEPLTAAQFHENISIPSTKKYVETIQDRYQFYKNRGRM